MQKLFLLDKRYSIFVFISFWLYIINDKKEDIGKKCFNFEDVVEYFELIKKYINFNNNGNIKSCFKWVLYVDDFLNSRKNNEK